MPWLEYNIHITGALTQNNVFSVLFNLIEPFVNSHRTMFQHWHYLFEPNVCGSTIGEVRLRFEGTTNNIATIRTDLIAQVANFKRQTNLIMDNTDVNGSHEGAHGDRALQYQGEAGPFGNDWNSIVEILQIGSESALKILRIGQGLTSNRSLEVYERTVRHNYYLHLPANQLLVEP